MVLYQMMLDDISTDSILQVWFSTGWSKKTLAHFHNSCFKVQADLELNLQENGILMELLSHWDKKTIDMELAHKLLIEQVQGSQLEPLANLHHKNDRVDFARYILTGHIFGEHESDYDYGNLTMFSLPDSLKKYERRKESFFYTIAIDYLEYRKSLLDRYKIY